MKLIKIRLWGKLQGGIKHLVSPTNILKGKKKKRKKGIYGVIKTLKRSISQSQW